MTEELKDCSPEEEKVNDMKIIKARMNVLEQGFIYRLKEHPRATAHIKDFVRIVNEMFEDYVLSDKLPMDNSPSEKEKMSSISGAATSQRQRV